MVNIKDIRSILTLLRRIIKYGVFILSFMCIVYCGLMYFGYDYFGIVKWIGTDKVKYIEACHDLAVAQLKDKDKANWVRWYFGVNSK